MGKDRIGCEIQRDILTGVLRNLREKKYLKEFLSYLIHNKKILKKCDY